MKENGIPTIVGVPLVSSIMNFHVGCPCSWFKLCPDRNFESDVEFDIDIKRNKCKTRLPKAIKGPLGNEELLTLFDESAKLPSWQDAIKVLRADGLDVGSYVTPFYWQMSMGTYKPVYFISQ